jgi:zinc transporter 9
MENLERFRIKRHLLIFSSSAPFGAMATYLFLAAVKEGADYTHLSGMFMLFSAGTFVYVAAAHVLPEFVSFYFHLFTQKMFRNQVPTTPVHNLPVN